MNDLDEPYRIEAASLGLALKMGIESPETIIQWADAIIHRESLPSLEIIEVSLLPPEALKTLVVHLREIAILEGHPLAARRVLGRFSYLAKHEVGLLREFFRALPVPNEVRESVDETLFDVLEESYVLAEQGILGTVEQVDKEFQSYLEGFETERSASKDWYSGLDSQSMNPIHALSADERLELMRRIGYCR